LIVGLGSLEMSGQGNNLFRNHANWTPIDQGGMGSRDRAAWVAGFVGANVVWGPRLLVI
jgi:hypothetical protein